MTDDACRHITNRNVKQQTTEPKSNDSKWLIFAPRHLKLKLPEASWGWYTVPPYSKYIMDLNVPKECQLLERNRSDFKWEKNVLERIKWISAQYLNYSQLFLSAPMRQTFKKWKLMVVIFKNQLYKLPVYHISSMKQKPSYENWRPAGHNLKRTGR